MNDVDQGCDADSPHVDAEVPIEFRILRGDDALAKYWIDVVVRDDDPALGREFTEHLAVRSIDARDGARRVVVEGRDFREVGGVREEDTAQDAQQGRRDEQCGDAGAACDADEVSGHEEPEGA